MISDYLSYLKKNLSTKKFWFRYLIRFFIFFASFYGILKLVFDYELNNDAVRYSFITIAPILMGAIACGWWCPAGLLQEIVFIKRVSIDVPDSIHKKARWLRYIFAILLVIGIFALTGTMQRTIGGFISAPSNFSLSLITYLSLTSVIFSVFINRFFCRYLCPFGALAGLKSLIRPITINRNKATCIGCGLCNGACPMKIKMSNCESSLSPNCINCFKCIEKCPKKALYLGARKYKSEDITLNVKDNLF